ncbi:MAG TPA: STAS domain-containing protein [Pirellulaceae bacterium]|jgi:anti-sigma B factor antagonist|nr:STAS domain-containing protein [Pirellulaceae bacterium]
MTGDQPFEERVVEDVTVVTFRDRRLIDSPEVETLSKALFALVELGERRNLLLDFSGVEFVSSAVLNKLVKLQRTLVAGGGSLKLVHLDGELHRIFAMTHLDRMFEIHADVDEGLAAFETSKR